MKLTVPLGWYIFLVVWCDVYTTSIRCAFAVSRDVDCRILVARRIAKQSCVRGWPRLMKAAAAGLPPPQAEPSQQRSKLDAWCCWCTRNSICDRVNLCGQSTRRRRRYRINYSVRSGCKVITSDGRLIQSQFQLDLFELWQKKRFEFPSWLCGNGRT